MRDPEGFRGLRKLVVEFVRACARLALARESERVAGGGSESTASLDERNSKGEKRGREREREGGGGRDRAHVAAKREH